MPAARVKRASRSAFAAIFIVALRFFPEALAAGMVFLDELPWDILVQRTAIWLCVPALGRLMCVCRQLVPLRRECSLWRLLFARACPCRTLQDDAPDWHGMMRLHCTMLARRLGDHLWLRVHFGNLLVPLPYHGDEDPAALLQRTLALLDPHGRPTTNHVACMRQVEAGIGGKPLLLLRDGVLVSGLLGCGDSRQRTEDGEHVSEEIWGTPEPLPRTMADLHLPAVADVILSVLDPSAAPVSLGAAEPIEPGAVPALGIRGEAHPEGSQQWIRLKILVPHLAEKARRGSGVGSAGSPSRWRSLASRAAGLNVGVEDGEGMGCVVCVQVSAAVEELSRVLEVHAHVPRCVSASLSVVARPAPRPVEHRRLPFKRRCRLSLPTLFTHCTPL